MLKDIPLTEITIGERHRKDLGDIAALAVSIQEVGLLHPIVVTGDYTLIVGRRRLAAFAHLERETIPALVVDLDQPLKAELDENDQRKDFTPSERVGIAEAILTYSHGQATWDSELRRWQPVDGSYSHLVHRRTPPPDRYCGQRCGPDGGTCCTPDRSIHDHAG